MIKYTVMNDEIIQDLKQFIASTVSQQTSELGRRLDGVDMKLDKVEQRLDGVEQRLDGVEQRLDGVEQRLDGVESKIDDLSTFVADALDTTNETTDAQLKDHETRIVKLEQKAA